MDGAVAAAPRLARRRAPLLTLLAANTISLVGNHLTALAIPWFVLETTDSPARAGLVAFTGLVPTILAAFFGGALVDRIGFKRTSILADLASGATVASVPLLHHTVGLPFAALLALVFLGALLDAPGGTARESLLPDLATGAGWPLERANGASQSVGGLASLFGPPLAGFLILALGPTNVLWLDAATFLVSAALVAVAVPAARGRQPAARERYLDQVLAGLRFLRGEPLLRTIALTATAANFLIAPLFGVLLAVYARETSGSAGDLGLLLAAVGAGSLTGSLLFGALGSKLPRRPLLLGSFLVGGLPFWVLAAGPPLAAAVAGLATTGIAFGALNPFAITLFQERAPVELRGRLFGTLMAISLVATPAGVLLSGALVDLVGLRPLLLGMGGAFLVIVAALARSPTTREMGRPAAAEPSERP